MKKQLSLIFTFLTLFSCIHSDPVHWSSPAILSEKGVDARDPEVAIDPNGNIIVAWIDNQTAKSRTKLAGDDWGPETAVSGTGTSAIKIVLDKDGSTTAIWIENGAVKVASKPLNGEWCCNKTLSDKASSSPLLAISNGGDIVAAWVRSGNMETAMKRAGSDWQPKVTLNTPPAYDPSLQIGGSGNNTRAVLVWEGRGSGIAGIFASTKLLNGNWSSPKIISEYGPNSKPSVAVDQKGNAVAIWYEYDKSSNDVVVSVVASTFSSLSGAWSGETRFDSWLGSGSSETLKALVGMGDSGNAVALWSQCDKKKMYTLQSATMDSNWSLPCDIINTNAYAFSFDLAVTSSGEGLSLYMLNEGTSLAIQSIESDTGGSLPWSVPTIISEGKNNAFPKIAASSSADGIHTAAVWVSFIDANHQISSSTGFKAVPKPKTTEKSKRFRVDH
jgi:hypothetical protein